MNTTSTVLSQAHQLHQSGRVQEAITLYEQILPQQNNNDTLLFLLGTAYRQTGRQQLAIELLRKSLRLNPHNAGAFNNLGNAFKDLNQVEDAIESYGEALRLAPDFADAHLSRGLMLRRLNRLEEALASYDEVLRINPQSAVALNNKGNVYQYQVRFSEALICYNRALKIQPDLIDLLWNKSLLLLLMGDFLKGWQLYECRFDKANLKKDYYNFPQPGWRGQKDLSGKTLLVHGEQGFGDVIQFCRYLPLVKAMGAEIILEVMKPLVPLVATLQCPITVIAKGEALPPFDAYCPVMSLPYAFKTTLTSIPNATPYLFSNPLKTLEWREKLGTRQGLRVGLVWSGTRTHKNDANRSIRLEELLPLTRLPIEWHSLQKEYREYDMDVLKQHPEIHQHQDHLNDYSDTAALIDCLDLVISVDTSVAHVAGAMGKPVFILLPFAPDFRWLLNREDSPWYPTARLYRQDESRSWTKVIQKLAADLTELHC